jgi:superfamily II DNA or RNA helicase
VDEIRAAFAHGHKRTLLVSPTGSGKTVMFSYLARGVRAKNKRVYILVHRDELVEQVSETLAKFDVPHGIIAAGRPATPSQVQVCSVFSLVNRLDDYPPPDLIIPDEAHHACSGSTWDRIFKAWPESFVLGVTATPIRLDGKPLKGSFAHMVLGPTPAELMEGGDLCGYTLYAPPVAIGKLKKRMGDYVKSETAAAMDKPQLVGNAVEHYKALAAGKRAIVFCVSLEHAENTAAAFRAAGFAAQRIDGTMKRGARKQLVGAFSAGTIQVLTSCDLVSEGFDLPAIEVAILMRPTPSLALYLQQVGRSLRPFPGKDKAIILDHAGNSGVHGLPDDDREWCLDGEESGRKGKAPPTLRLCGRCYAHTKSGVMVCPHCQWAWPAEAREVEAVSGELEVVSPDEVARVKLDLRREVGMAKTAEALIAIEKARGYKPGWHRHVLAARGGVR